MKICVRSVFLQLHANDIAAEGLYVFESLDYPLVGTLVVVEQLAVSRNTDTRLLAILLVNRRCSFHSE